MAKRSRKKKAQGQEPRQNAAVGFLDSLGQPPLPWPVLGRALLIAVLACWAFYPALHGNWLMDDDLYLSGNETLHAKDGLWKFWFDPGDFIEYYPIEESVLWIEWFLWQDHHTFGYHLVTLAVHIGNAFLVWRLFWKMGLRLAWLAGLLFAIHPLMAETVCWISELKNTLSLAPGLVAMGCYVDYINTRNPRDYLLTLAFFLISMLCKITLAPFFLIMLLYAWCKTGRLTWRDVLDCIPFLVFGVLISYISSMAGKLYLVRLHELPEHVVIGGPLVRVALMGLTYLVYLTNYIWPVQLLPIYPLWPVNPPQLWQFLPWLAYGVALAWFLVRRKTWGRWVILGFGFFTLTIAPLLGAIPISFMFLSWVFNHLTYLPIVGLIGLTIAGVELLDQRLSPRWHRIGAVALTFFFGGLTIVCHETSVPFVTIYQLSLYDLQYNPTSWLARNNVASEELTDGYLDESIAEFKRALVLQPDSITLHNNLANAYMKAFRVPEALVQIEASIAINPRLPQPHFDRANAYMLAGRIDEAIQEYLNALALSDNSYPLARCGLGNALTSKGKYEEAISQLNEAIMEMPDNAASYYNLGNALIRVHRPAEAVENYRKAFALNPQYQEAHNNCGIGLMQLGDRAGAVEQFREALRVKPGFADAVKNMTMILGKPVDENGNPR